MRSTGDCPARSVLAGEAMEVWEDRARVELLERGAREVVIAVAVVVEGERD